MKHVTIVSTSTPDLDDILTLAEIKTFGRIDGSSEDALLTALRDAAARWIEDLCNTSLGDRTAYAYLDHFYTARIPRGPVNSITAVEYLDANNTWATLPATSYWYDLETETARITFDDLPDVYDDAFHRVRITLNYGHPEESIPAPLIQALQMLTLAMYDNRAATTQHTNPKEMPFGVYALTNPYRIA